MEMNMIKKITLCFLVIFPAAFSSYCQTGSGTMPRLISENGRHALLVDGEPYFILGAQSHNSSGWPDMLPQLWSAIQEVHANTLEVPVYWEQIEPRQGQFNFSLVDILINQAREQKIHLVLLWFATWKNGSSHYMPRWMKTASEKYPNITGKNGKPVDSPSPNIPATKEADMQAFKTLMKYLKKVDEPHTVIMIQVENESGSWGSVRDYSPVAQKLFDSAVPAELLNPPLLTALHVPVVSEGSWQKVFGERADEYFQAWSVARFIGEVAAAGKSEYALPMYVNAALRDPLTNPMATNYESGGPTDNVIPIWKAAAPAIDLVAPDIYLQGSERIMKVIDLYNRPDNALLVPELGWSVDKVKYLYEVMARGGIGFSPFGIDDNGRKTSQTEISARLAPLAQEYSMAAPMMRELAKWGFEGKIKAVVEREDHADQTIDLGDWQAVVSFGSGERKASDKINTEPTGKLMIVKLDENKFVLTGTRCRITFHPIGKNSGKDWQYLNVEEGRYDNGIFKSRRILNGDETDWGGPRFDVSPDVVQAELIVR
jgi:Domain of unknown function (DUF5597)/Beta-galactosidase